MAGRDIIVIGASAGGVEALMALAGALPAGLPAAVFVVCHFPAAARSALPEILSRRGPLLAAHARDGEPTYPGHIYVAPPDYHLLLEPGVARVTRGPRENHFRPSIDVLFRSAARAYGPRVVGVLLSGALSDGLAGLLAVRAAGGLAAAQAADDALLPELPQAAVAVAGASVVAPARELGAVLSSLIHQPAAPTPGGDMTDPLEQSTEAVKQAMQAQVNGQRRGDISVFSCPECGGALWQVDEERLLRFRCHVGHVYHGEALLEEQAAGLEAALWTAVRTFRERELLARQLAEQARAEGDAARAGRFADAAGVAARNGELIQKYLLQGHAPPELAPVGPEGPKS